MTVKEKVLDLLLNSKGEYISGEQTAASLHVTRSAIWKSIRLLRAEGFSVEAVPNKGYILLESCDIITEAGIKKHLIYDSAFTIDVYDVVSSTNSLMRERTACGEGNTIIAKKQTKGVGRSERCFFSPESTGIYFSLLLKPELEARQSVIITTMAAAAVCKTIEEVTGKSPRIKWVNDIFLDGKKICGILTQGSFSMETNMTEYIILGIGMNIYAPKGGFPDNIAGTAGYLLPHEVYDIKNRLVAGILDNFWDMYKSMDPVQIAQQYRHYSCVIGRRITVHSAGSEIPAKVLDINEKCNLIVQFDDGSTKILSSGEISITL